MVRSRFDGEVEAAIGVGESRDETLGGGVEILTHIWEILMKSTTRVKALVKSTKK